MPLFTLNNDLPINGTGATIGPPRRSFGTGTPSVALADAIGELQTDTDVHYVSAGAWALHDLIRYCLDRTGPGDVIGFTWSMTNSAIDAILDMIGSGLIRRFSLAMDATHARLAGGAFETIRQHCERSRLCSIHAKGFTLAAGAWRISCAMSQNLTQNPRYEVGVLSTCPRVYDFHRAWLDPLLDGGDPLDVETVSKHVPREGGD